MINYSFTKLQTEKSYVSNMMIEGLYVVVKLGGLHFHVVWFIT